MAEIYVASKTAHAGMWRTFRDGRGYPICSTWIDEAKAGKTANRSELAERCVREAALAKVLILYCEPGEILKGALIEAGAHLACGGLVLCVGTCASVGGVMACHPRWRNCGSVQEAMERAMLEVNCG